ncbi:hypothetical protein EV291_1164 [Rhizobium sp. BK068]|nr:hypothetical protein EV291_1164 [Rhizobium sp. BK068]
MIPCDQSPAVKGAATMNEVSKQNYARKFDCGFLLRFPGLAEPGNSPSMLEPIRYWTVQPASMTSE